MQLGKGLLPSRHGHFAKIGGGNARFPLEEAVEVLFGAEAEAEGDLRELQARECQIALGALHAGFLDEIVVGQAAVSAENHLELVLVDTEPTADLLDAAGVHEVAVDANDDIAVRGEGQGVVSFRLDLMGVLRLQAREDIHKIGADAAGPAFVGVFLLYGGYGGVTDAEVVVHLLGGHVDAFQICVGLHERSKSEQVIGLGQDLIYPLLHNGGAHIDVDKGGGEHQVIDIPRLPVIGGVRHGFTIPQADRHGGLGCHRVGQDLARLTVDGQGSLAASDQNEGKVAGIGGRCEGDFTALCIEQDRAVELFRGACQLHDGLLDGVCKHCSTFLRGLQYLIGTFFWLKVENGLYQNATAPVKRYMGKKYR